MARLIDADACPALFDEQYKVTRQLINQGETHLDNLAEGFTEADRVIRQIPTVDAVEVVRCEKCIHYKGDIVSSKHSRGSCEFDNERKSRNHFCSYGESKDRNA